MFCQKCGKEITGEQKFCLHCGTKIGEVLANNSVNEKPEQYNNRQSAQKEQAINQYKKKKLIIGSAAAVFVCILLFIFVLPSAISNIGKHYDDQRNYGKAAFWYNIAANIGNNKAQCTLGFYYCCGYQGGYQGIQKDYGRGLYWLRLAAHGKDPYAAALAKSELEVLGESW